MTDKSPFNTKLVLLFLTGTLLGFVVGFALANGINRTEQDRLRAQVAQARAGVEVKPAGADDKSQGKPQNASGGDDSIPTLTDEQLRSGIARADASPGDLELQRKTGQGLFYYVMKTGKTSVLPDVARILKRVHDADPKDYQSTVLAGNAHFLVARGGGDAHMLGEARKLYEQALVTNPNDMIVRTSFGLTYFYDKPPDTTRAMREFRRVLQAEPRNEMALQSLASALIETGDFDEAEKRLDELGQVNSQNQELSNLRAQLEQKRNAAKEKK
ncbi:MAG TPA: tetratricopeptide repeat protein [Pyrinomonadaceae bacterium]|jgi:tetratricopeptide (TPR) repeat protein|nr:tetratricopeptide repeat protein [Pyrinomonadaceae bacterium]